jgi:sugar/nucleoside kinase (ribokinase family)
VPETSRQIGKETTVLVACLGDIMLDVLVNAPAGLVPDDDTPARITFAAGGQAANVAAWVRALGGQARVFGPRASTGPGRLVEEALTDRGVEVHGPLVDRSGTVLSMVADGVRSLASDAADDDWLDEVAPGNWLAGADWLMVSGYALLRAAHPHRIVDTAAAARAAGARVAVDLASASMITEYGAARFRALWQSLAPAAVFATDAEWAATSVGGDGPVGGPGGAGGTTVLVLKHGADGASFVIDGIPDDRARVPGPVVDVTGAGDALTAGYLMGGTDLAMTAAARCIAEVGAQPAGTDRASR